MITFTRNVDLVDTMQFEAIYHENLQPTIDEKRSMLDGAFAVWMLIDGKLAGESYGSALESRDETVALKHRLPGTAIYCYSNTILPEFQNRGYGRILKAYWLGMIREWYSYCFGHARPGGSQALNTRFGAEWLETVPNWCGTGEDYKLYRMALK